MAPKTYDELAEDVRSRGCIAPYSMGMLRDIDGAGKLGTFIRASITNQLHARHLRTFPEELPRNQDEYVRVYVLGSEVGKVVDAVLHPSGAGDVVLRAIGGDDDAREKLEQIRKILG